MAKILEINQMAAYISSIKDPIKRGYNIAVVEMTTRAKGDAVKNAMKTFKGTRERPKTGRLSSSIFYAFETNRNGFVEGFVEARAIYGRIHEYGGTIKPRNAKNLWIPLFGPKSTGKKAQFKNLTPSDFYSMMKNKKGGQKFSIFDSKKGNKIAAMIERYKGKSMILPLFLLKKEVSIPARPYITPAIVKNLVDLPDLIRKRIKEQVEREAI